MSANQLVSCRTPGLLACMLLVSCPPAPGGTGGRNWSIEAIGVSGGMPLPLDVDDPCMNIMLVSMATDVVTFRGPGGVVDISVAEVKRNVYPRNWYYSPPMYSDEIHLAFQELGRSPSHCHAQRSVVVMGASLVNEPVVLMHVQAMAAEQGAIAVMPTAGPKSGWPDEPPPRPHGQVLTRKDGVGWPGPDLRLVRPIWWVEEGTSPTLVQHTLEGLAVRGATCLDGPWHVGSHVPRDVDIRGRTPFGVSEEPPGVLSTWRNVDLREHEVLYGIAFTGQGQRRAEDFAITTERGCQRVSIIAGQVCAIDEFETCEFGRVGF